MGVVDSGRPLLCMGALGAQAKLVSDPVLGLQHPAQTLVVPHYHRRGQGLWASCPGSGCKREDSSEPQTGRGAAIGPAPCFPLTAGWSIPHTPHSVPRTSAPSRGWKERRTEAASTLPPSRRLFSLTPRRTGYGSDLRPLGSWHPRTGC